MNSIQCHVCTQRLTASMFKQWGHVRLALLANLSLTLLTIVLPIPHNVSACCPI